MLDLQTVNKIVDWLIFKGLAGSRRELASKLGYTESGFSQIMNGKVPLSEKFTGKLLLLDPTIKNKFFKNGGSPELPNNNSKIYNPMENQNQPLEIIQRHIEVIHRQEEHLIMKEGQINQLLEIIKGGSLPGFGNKKKESA